MIQRTVAVVGLGKIGLPLAVHYATRGHRVLGCDINPELVELVNNGIEPFPGEDNLDSSKRPQTPARQSASAAQ